MGKIKWCVGWLFGLLVGWCLVGGCLVGGCLVGAAETAAPPMRAAWEVCQNSLILKKSQSPDFHKPGLCYV